VISIVILGAFFGSAGLAELIREVVRRLGTELHVLGLDMTGTPEEMLGQARRQQPSSSATRDWRKGPSSHDDHGLGPVFVGPIAACRAEEKATGSSRVVLAAFPTRNRIEHTFLDLSPVLRALVAQLGVLGGREDDDVLVSLPQGY
jgi:hypothetical protein